MDVVYHPSRPNDRLILGEATVGSFTVADPVAPSDPITGTRPSIDPMFVGDRLGDRVNFGTATYADGLTPIAEVYEQKVGAGEWVAYDPDTVTIAAVYLIRKTLAVTDPLIAPVTLTSDPRTAVEYVEPTSGYIPPAISDPALTTDPTQTVPDTATPEMLSSFTVDGVTFTLDKAMPVVFDPTGDPIIVSSEAFTFTTTPASAVIDGYRGNGLMKNPSRITVQGWDESAGLDPNTTLSAVFPYDEALDIDPGRTGSPVSVAEGEAASYVKAVRLTGRNLPRWNCIEKYVVLSVVPTTPAAGAFRPGFADPAKAVRGYADWADANNDCLQSLTFPAGSGAYIVEPTRSGFDRTKRQLIHFGHSGGQRFRRLDVAHEPGESTYTGNLGGVGYQRAIGAIWLHSNAPYEAKQRDYFRAIKHGIDIYGAYLAGWRGNLGAGQHHGYLPYLYIAAFALKDADMLAAAREMRANCVSQMRWTPPEWIGAKTEWPGAKTKPKLYYKTYYDEDLGKPTWFLATASNQNIAGHAYARYKMQATQPSFFEVGAILLLQNGPGGINGEQAIRLGRNDSTSARASVLAWLDRYRTWTAGTSEDMPAAANSIWDFIRATVDRPLYEATPDHPSDRQVVVAGGTGVVSVTTAAKTGSANPAVTRRDLQWSNDGGFSWTYVEDYTLGTNVSVPRQFDTHLQVRNVNALGAGPWSANYLFDESKTVEQGVVPATSSRGTGSLDFSPVIVYPRYPGWAGRYFEVLGEDLPEGIFRLACGMGQIAGTRPVDGTPPPEFVWRINGTPIADLPPGRGLWLSQSYAGGDLDCLVSWGGVTRQSNVFTLPETIPTPVLPEGYLSVIDFTNKVSQEAQTFIDSALDPAVDRIWYPGLFTPAWTGVGAIVQKRTPTRKSPSITGALDLSAFYGQEIEVIAITATDPGVLNQGNYGLGVWTQGGSAPGGSNSLDGRDRPAFWMTFSDSTTTSTGTALAAAQQVYTNLDANGFRIIPGVLVRKSVPFTPTVEGPRYLRITGSGGYLPTSSDTGGNANLLKIIVRTPGVYADEWEQEPDEDEEGDEE